MQRPNQWDEYAQKVAAEGGVSVDPTSGKSPSQGFMVAYHGAERILDRQPSGTDLANFASENSEALKGNYLGAWHEEGKTYLDVSTNVPDRATADRIGRDEAQRAIFDLQTFKDPKVRGHAQPLQHKGSLFEEFSTQEQRHLGRANQEYARATKERELTATKWNAANERKPAPSTAQQLRF